MIQVEETDSDSVAVAGHVMGVFLPILGPAVLLIVYRSRGRFVRVHLAASLVVSTAWMALAVLVIAVDLGRLSVDDQKTSTMGLLGLVAVFSLTFALIGLNLHRVKRRQLPIGWRRGG